MSKIMSNEIIRSIVGRREAQFIFQGYKDDDARRIAEVLFTTPWLSSSSTYLVRSPRIRTVSELSAKLTELQIDSEQLLGDIKSLLVLDDDLTPPPFLVEPFLTGKKIAVFTGAGVSSLLGVPRWPQLAERAVKFLRTRLMFSDQECKYLQAQFPNPKDVVSVFHKFVPKSSDKSREFYSSNLVNDTASINVLDNPYYHLARLNCVKITSNIENEFGKAVEKYKTDQVSAAIASEDNASSIPPLNIEISQVCIGEHSWNDNLDLCNDCVYHLHGVLERPSTLIMTSEDYVDAYYTTGNVFDFLKNLFADYTVIFIGCGLGEYDVLEKVMSNRNQHYALVPINSAQIGDFEFQRKYFESFNIRPVPFFVDQTGHNRLLSVLKHWADYIDRLRSKEFLERRAILEEAL